MVTAETLAHFEVFEGLPDNALQAIVPLCREVSFASGTKIFTMGHLADRIYLLLEGTVRLTIHATALPEPMTITVINTPDRVLGWSAIIGSGHYSSTALAVTDVRAIAIDGHALMDFLNQNPCDGYVVMMRVAQVISQRLGAMRKLLLETVIDYEKPATATAEN